jgi:protein SCO1/2
MLVATQAVALADDEPVGVPPPPAVQAVEIDEHVGLQVPLDLAFVDERGDNVTLADYFADGKPVLLILAWYHCPMLCGLVLQGTAQALAQLDWRLGEQYRVLTVSFDPSDGPQDAFRKQVTTLQELGRTDAADAWPFLTGKHAAIARLADALGFRYAWDSHTEQYAHAAVIFALSPTGEIARYLYGVDYPARDLKLALLDASQGRAGSVGDRLLMTCYHYDPASRRYGFYILGALRVGGVAVVLFIGLLLGVLWARERRNRKAHGEGAGARAGEGHTDG